MRTFILLAAMAAIALPSAASAQQREVRHDRREIRQDRRELRHDRRAGESRRQLRQDRHELRRDRRDLRQDRRQVRQHRRIAYVAPYRGWRYRPVTVGYQLRPAFYGSRYYINDYGAYRLRAPGRWQRWIRYGDDLLLVNVRTGRVVQVLRYRYW